MDHEELQPSKKVLSQSLLELGEQAFDPSVNPVSRGSSLQAFDDLVQR